MFTSRGILVHYKVYLKNGDGSNIEIRRFDSQDVHYLGFNSLCSKLKNIFPELGDKNYTTSWIDEDNEEIKITCDEELSTALDIAVKEYSRYKETLLLDRPIIKLYVKLNQKNKNAQFFQKEEIIHDNVICDSCDNAISGFRYKCMICEDYDLCSQCEMLGLHAEHYMLRMLQPLNWSTHSGKRLLDHIKKFFKRKIRSYYYDRESSDHETRKEKQPEENVAATSENIVEEFPKRNTKLIDQTVVELQLASDNAFVSHNNTTSAVNPLMEEWTILDKNDISRTSSVSFNLNESSENNLATVPTSTTATTSAAMSVETKTASVATLMATPVATSTYTSATTSATTPGATAVCTSVITPVTTSVSTSATTSVTAPMRSSPLPIYPQLPKESRIHHPNSRIHNALLALITMGYSNNGGVLTHLLETENGDINKVIDILEYGKG